MKDIATLYLKLIKKLKVNMKKLTFALIILLLVLFLACSEKIVDNKVLNLSPETKIFLFVDPGATISKQKSKITIYWWGDDPDGFVVGYFIKWENDAWGFTTKTDSTFALKIAGSDTTLKFFVAAVDNNGNKKYDERVIRNGVDFGAEHFIDANGNGKYDEGENFIDLGDIDPTPAEFVFPIQNSPPEIKFQKGTTVPETTFTVASFAWNVSDIDGDETIDKIYIALNDTSNFIEIPGYVNLVTIVSKPPFTGDVVSCDIYFGSSTVQPYHTKLPNLKVGTKNFFYVKAKDNAGAYSKTIVMPDTTRTWFVKKPSGKILLIDDYTVADRAEDFYRLMLDSLGFSGKYDFFDIKYGKTSTTPGILLPHLINPTFTETLRLYDMVIWFTDNDPSLEVAQLSIRNYVERDGKILLSMIFPQFFDTRSLGDFLPVDSVSPTPIGFIPLNTPINLTTEGVVSGYPYLQRDGNPAPVARIRTFYPSEAGAKSLYTIGISGAPVIGFKDIETKRIFIGLPLHRLNGGPSNIKTFLRKVIIEEFGVTP